MCLAFNALLGGIAAFLLAVEVRLCAILIPQIEALLIGPNASAKLAACAASLKLALQ
jgi:hypothetical protein